MLHSLRSTRSTRSIRSIRSISTATLSLLSPTDIQTLATRLSPLTSSLLSDLQTLQSSPTLRPNQASQLRLLTPLTPLISESTSLISQLSDVQTLKLESQNDPDLLQLADEEHELLSTNLTTTTVSLLSHLLQYHLHTSHSRPSHPHSAILELRAGAGGEEAALFVADLHLMYSRLASRQKWTLRPLSRSETSLGGIRELILRVSGTNVATLLQTEAGVHRVQRVPTTETQGRVHTSTASVAVLSDGGEAAQKIKLADSEIRIDVYRASGAGGQHVNKTESAVRITHLETGLVATSQDERSQHRNRALAMEALLARIAARREAERVRQRVEERRKQLGETAGERSDRVRTYNYLQKRVTDHRLVAERGLLEVLPSVGGVFGEKNAGLDAVLEGGGELERIMEAVRRVEELEGVREMIKLAEKVQEKGEEGHLGRKATA